MNQLRNNFILYPFLLGLYPVLALIANNAREMDFSSGLRALLFSLLFTLLLYLLLIYLLRNPVKAALLTSLSLLLFYSYGHINLLARDCTFLGLSIGRHRILLPLYLVIFSLASWLVLRTRRDLTGSTRLLNAFSLILLVMPFFQVGAAQLAQYQVRSQEGPAASHQYMVNASPGQSLPDIYYLLLDGYPRGDFINQHLGSSNREFLEALEQRGFYVAHCSQANYSDTRFSLASTLNMQYLDGGQAVPEVVYSGATLDEMIRSGTVQQNFADLGYSLITFESGYKWLRWALSDWHLKLELSPQASLAAFGLNDFERLLLDTTAAKFLFDLPVLLDSDRAAGLNEFIENPRAVHRERVLYALDQLPQIPFSYPSPKFVYAHIVFPHPPFIVDAQGAPLQNSPPDELAAYADHITYLDRRMLEIIDAILDSSASPPVIILQGDHGATIAYEDQEIDPAERLGILNAYYLPLDPASDGSQALNPMHLLHPDISPVNTFRLVFDTYFDAGYGMLEDQSILGRQSPYIKLDCALPE